MPLSNTVRREVLERFASSDAPAAVRYLESLPAAALPSWPGDRERVLLGILKLADGDLVRLETAVSLAGRDWRDLLVAAGLENEDWPQILRAAGYRLP